MTKTVASLGGLLNSAIPNRYSRSL